MMTARVIHFGWDDCYRVPVLRAAGFEVKETGSLNELRASLQSDEPVDAVIVSEETEPTAERAAELVHHEGPAPVILFRRSQHSIDEKMFDKIYTCTTPPEVWVSETVALIGTGYRLQGESARLQVEAAAAQAEFQRQRIRAQRLRGPRVDRR